MTQSDVDSTVCRTMQQVQRTPHVSAFRCGSQRSRARPAAAYRTEFRLERRSVVLSWLLPLLPVDTARAVEVAPAKVRPELAPDPSIYDASDPHLRAAAQRLQEALDTADVREEERIWSEIIDTYASLDAPWVPEIVGRAWGNRVTCNCRSRQGKMEAAIADFNKAIEICPWSIDPVLNRGVVLESIGQFDDAIRDYRSLLKVAPYDPAVWNNLGNSYAGKGEWAKAADYYGRASALAPDFAFARANRATAMYQTGEEEEALRLIRSLLQKYPDFTDMRAAHVAILWREGREGEAETEWERVQDPRYSDPRWLVEDRRWPPKLVDGLTAFLKLKSFS